MIRFKHTTDDTLTFLLCSFLILTQFFSSSVDASSIPQLLPTVVRAVLVLAPVSGVLWATENKERLLQHCRALWFVNDLDFCTPSTLSSTNGNSIRYLPARSGYAMSWLLLPLLIYATLRDSMRIIDEKQAAWAVHFFVSLLCVLLFSSFFLSLCRKTSTLVEKSDQGMAVKQFWNVEDLCSVDKVSVFRRTFWVAALTQGVAVFVTSFFFLASKKGLELFDHFNHLLLFYFFSGAYLLIFQWLAQLFVWLTKGRLSFVESTTLAHCCAFALLLCSFVAGLCTRVVFFGCPKSYDTTWNGLPFSGCSLFLSSDPFSVITVEYLSIPVCNAFIPGGSLVSCFVNFFQAH